MKTIFKNGDSLNLMKTDCNDLSVDLAITDPPYFKVIGQQWDYQWRTMNDYVGWCDQWIEVLSQKLRYGGSWYLFGYFRNLVSLVPIAEKHGFVLRQQILLDKGIKSIAGRKTSTYKMFPNVTESVLFFVRDNKQIIKPMLKARAEELGLSSKEINERLGVKSNGGGMWSIYTGKNICEQFPTKRIWERLMRVLDMNEPYEKYAQVFNPIVGYTDIWTDIDFYFNDRIHPTQKPYELIERIILASSKKDDLILDPFAGSGVTALCAENNSRNSILFELDTDYYRDAISFLKTNNINVFDNDLIAA